MRSKKSNDEFTFEVARSCRRGGRLVSVVTEENAHTMRVDLEASTAMLQWRIDGLGAVCQRDEQD